MDKGRKMGGRKENWSCEGCRVEELTVELKLRGKRGKKDWKRKLWN